MKIIHWKNVKELWFGKDGNYVYLESKGKVIKTRESIDELEELKEHYEITGKITDEEQKQYYNWLLEKVEREGVYMFENM